MDLLLREKMQTAQKQIRKSFDRRITPGQLMWLYEQMQFPKEEIEIVIDSYYYHLPDKILKEKYLCSKATLVRHRSSFWLRMASCMTSYHGLMNKCQMIVCKLMFIWLSCYVLSSQIIIFENIILIA